MAIAKQVKSHLLSILKTEDWFRDEELGKELPLKWEKHGDLVLLPETAFATTHIWLEHKEILETTCKLLRCNRLARRVGPTQSDDFRSPKVQMLYGNSTWVTKKENGILYSWDLSKCMFSSGNITEKQRIGSWNLKGQTVVDMYSGIGYFTMTYLVHSKAELVYACEWNPDAVEALKANLKLNKISPDRCIILFGDNRLTCPKDVADHVNLGLIPSSEDGWKGACGALRRETGGILHVHGNVDVKLKSVGVEIGIDPNKDNDNDDMSHSINYERYAHNQWADDVSTKIQSIFTDLYPNQRWTVKVDEVVKVKSFAPHVDHLVADISCKPVI